MVEVRAHALEEGQGVDAGGRGVRQVERVVREPVVGGVDRGAEGRDVDAGAAATLHPLRGLVVLAEDPVGAHGEHVLHRDRDTAVGLEFGDERRELLHVATLPPERRVHHDGRGAELLRGGHRPREFGDGVATPDPLRDEQTGRVHRQHRHGVAVRQIVDVVDVLADLFAPHHQLDAVEPQLAGVLERGLGVLRIDRRGRQSDGDVDLDRPPIGHQLPEASRARGPMVTTRPTASASRVLIRSWLRRTTCTNVTSPKMTTTLRTSAK